MQKKENAPNENTQSRNLNLYFQQAIELVRSEFPYWDYTKFNYEKVKSYANNYYDDVSDKAILLYNEAENKLLALEYINRLSSNYIKRINKKLYRIKRLLNNSEFTKYAYFITLTQDAKLCRSVMHSKNRINNAWNKLRTILSKHKKFKLLHYVRVIEFHESNIAHLHIVAIFNDKIDFNEFNPYLANLWRDKWNMGIFFNIKKVYTKYVVNKNKEVLKLGAGSYLFKYLYKGYGEGEDNNKTKVLAWATRARSYSISRSLLSLINYKTNSNKTGEWIFLGIIELSVFMHMSEEDIRREYMLENDLKIINTIV